PVVETASLVFPPDKLKSLAVAEPRDRITRIVLIDEGRWGLAVDAIEEVITLQHDKVRWRSERTQRKWLLGTVVDHMCALIDPHAFAEKLSSGKD
ncbi:MAG: chemotaxis protein CheW, partial [Gammaproteobacteria bacterium]|nr:chemotaxis protein CheW [Gammaproteobacteria bacterium]